jgi:hypothetical protein
MSDCIEVICVVGEHRTPTRDDCEVATSIKLNSYTRYYRIIRLLMIAGFCLLCCVTASGQDLVITERASESLVITERAASQQSDFYVVMYSGDSCPPCRYYKSSGQLARLEKMLPVKVINTGIDRTWHKGGIPCFWLCRRQGRVAIHKWQPGAISPETIAAKIKEIERRTTTDPTEVNSMPEGFYDASIYNGNPGSSHENRSSLIRHLYEDGTHKGLREMAELNAMSDAALDAAHERDHKRKR